MHAHRKTRISKILAVLLLPLALLLTACELAIDVAVDENEQVDLAMTIELPQDLLDMAGGDITCDDLASEIAGEDEDVVIEDQSGDSGMRCLVKSKEPESFEKASGDTMQFAKEGDDYVVKVLADEEAASIESDMAELGVEPSLKLSFTFPGEVKSVQTDLDESEYTIDGNKVEFATFKVFAAETVITAAATAPQADAGADAGTTAGDGASAGQSNTTMWVIIVIVAIVIIAGVVYAVMRSKKQQQVTPPTPNQPPNNITG